MHFSEGDKVAYVGTEFDGLRVGDAGRVVALAGGSNHVQWTSGVRRGAMHLVADHDLTPLNAEVRADVEAVLASHHAEPDALSDSLEYGSLVTFSSRKVFEEGGGLGVTEALAEDGCLATLASHAEDLVADLALRVRTDPSVAMALGELDEDEVDSVVMSTVQALLAEATGEDED